MMKKLKISAVPSLFWISSLIPLCLLGLFLFWLLNLGLMNLTLPFLTGASTATSATTGVGAAIIGTLQIMLWAYFLAIPVGMGAAIYLEEYSSRPLWIKVLERNLAALAGLPSILYGLIGLGVFVRWLELGPSLLSAGLTLALLALPMVVLTSQQALRGVDPSLRTCALALGARKDQLVFRILLPSALPSMLSGGFISVARVIGEAAPLLLLGAWSYVNFYPVRPTDALTALPVQIFQWSGDGDEKALANAASATLLLLVILLLTRLGTLWLRAQVTRRRGV